MSKFYASGSQIAELLATRDDIVGCRAAMDAALRAAKWRTLVVPKMRGGYLPHILKTTSQSASFSGGAPGRTDA